LVTELAKAKSPTKVYPLSETPASFTLHVNKRSLLLNSSVYFRTHSVPAGEKAKNPAPKAGPDPIRKLPQKIETP